jgi:LmbE family N-acetylglucosaminyl deacetylase
MTQRILVVSAHIGDEILGCGGTLALHVARGDRVRVLVLGEGWTSRTASVEKGLEALDLEAFETQGRHALTELGIDSVRFDRLPDNRFDRVPLLDIVKAVEAEKPEFRPNRVYTNSPFDLGLDQRLTCRAVTTAFRPQPGDNETDLLAFEVLSSTEWNYGTDKRSFEPNLFIDIDPVLSKKLAAFGRLSTETRDWPHARSADAITHHARVRGSSVGLAAAEAFMQMRSVRRQP